MKIDYKRNLRKWTALFIAVICYFLPHEGAYWIYARCIGTFKQINFIGTGIQVDIYRELMSDVQLGIFCLVGSVATIISGYILMALTQKFLLMKSNYLRAITYYLTIAFLVADPLYLSILSLFVGGGDMNGIILIMPEFFVRTVSGMIAAINIFIIIKLIIPKYREAYQKAQRRR